MSENKYFRPAGDLDEDRKDLIYPKTEKMVDYFRPAGDLDGINNDITRKIDNNREIINKIDNIIDKKVDDYLLTVVSGKRYDGECELGTLCGGGRVIVSFDTFRGMVDSGYNIISAEYINKDMIEVEYQQFRKDNDKGRRR